MIVMKKILVFGLVLLFSLTNAQLTEVYTFTEDNKPSQSDFEYRNQLLGNKLFYINVNSQGQCYLFYKDGSGNPPVSVKNVTAAGATSTMPTTILTAKVSGNYFYFSTFTKKTNTNSQHEIWRTDGTEEGTVKLLSYDGNTSFGYIKVDNHPIKTTANPENSVNGGIIFSASPTPATRSIWFTDGTVSGTQLLKEFAAPEMNSYSVWPMEKVGNRMLFIRYNTDKFIAGRPWELWSTDGTPGGTQLLTNINYAFGKLNNAFYFVDFDRPNAVTYTEDGLTVGTKPAPNFMITGSQVLNGEELMFWNMSQDNTKQLYHTTNFNAVSKIAELGTEPINFITGNDYGAFGYQKISGTNTFVFFDRLGNKSVMQNNLYSNSNPVITLGNTIYMGAKEKNDPNKIGNELWRFDNVHSDLALDIRPGVTTYQSWTFVNETSPSKFFILDDQLYFFINDSGITKLVKFNGDFTFTNTAGNNLWTDRQNWKTGAPPMLTDKAIIPTGMTPTVNSTAYVTDLTIASPLNLNSDLNIIGNVNLNSKITLNNSKLNLKGISSTITGGNATNYIVTNGTGTVNVENVNAERGTVNLPIGTATNYNPVSIANTGTSDTFSARVSDGISNTTNGAVNATWEISEATAGGSNVSLTLGWNTSQQNAAFDSGTAKVGHYLNGSWTEENSGAVSNNSITATGISTFSPFAVMNFGALAASDFSKSKVLIYPNPFNENLNISTENGGVVNFYDLSGKLVSTSVLMKGTNSLNKSSLSKGVYIYQIKNANDEILSSGKIIKK